MADPQPTRALPARPSIEWLKKTAKQRLVALRADDPAAKLSTAQLAVAREYGFTSWRSLTAKVKTASADPAELPADEKALQQVLRDAIHAHDLATITRCLTADPSLANAPLGDFGARPIAVAGGHGPTVDLLIRHGADIDLKSDWWAGGWGVLDMADAATAATLIERGAAVDVFAAAHLDRLDRLRELLAADPSLVHAKGGDGGRPLHFARSDEAAELILSLGADINARDVDHESTAAQWAVQRPGGEQAIPGRQRQALQRVRWLVERGAAVDVFMLAALDDADRLARLLDEDPSAIEAKTGSRTYAPCPDAPGRHIYVYQLNEGRTPFEVARAFGSARCADLLLSRSTPRQRLLAACAIGDRAAATALLRDRPGAMAELTPEDANALPNAAWGGDTAAVLLMLDLGFDPATMPASAASALHCAAWHGRAELTRAFLNHPAVQSRWAELLAIVEPTYQSTPLGWCCHGSTHCRNATGDYPAVAKLLLDAGSAIGPNAGDASAAVKIVLDSDRPR